ncbi:hypothetical protein HKD37_08G023178 [Glycine soja]
MPFPEAPWFAPWPLAPINGVPPPPQIGARRGLLGEIVKTLHFMVSPVRRKRSVETRGLARRRQTVDAAPYSLPLMPKREHGMYYTPPVFTQEPSQMAPMYSYPHDFQPGYNMTGIFGSSPPSGGTPSFTQNNELSTPNAPLSGPWNVPGNIPDMDDLLGVDLRHDFSTEAGEVDERGNRRRRNPDRAARN